MSQIIYTRKKYYDVAGYDNGQFEVHQNNKQYYNSLVNDNDEKNYLPQPIKSDKKIHKTRNRQYHYPYCQNNDKPCSCFYCDKNKNNCDSIFGYVYNIAQGPLGVQTLQPCNATTPEETKVVKFNSVGPLSGIKFSGTDTLILPVDGIYEANYTVRAGPVLGTDISLKLLKMSENNSTNIIAGSVYTSPINIDGTASINGMVRFIANSRDKIKLINNSTTQLNLYSRTNTTNSFDNTKKISPTQIGISITNSATSYGRNITINASNGNSIYVFIQHGQAIGVVTGTQVVDDGNNIYLKAASISFNNDIFSDIWYSDNINVPANNELTITLLGYDNFTVQTVTEVLEIQGAAFPSFSGIRNGNITGSRPDVCAVIDTPEIAFGLASFVATSTTPGQSFFSAGTDDFFLPNPSTDANGDLFVAGAVAGQVLVPNQTNVICAAVINVDPDVPFTLASLIVSIIPATSDIIPVAATASSPLNNGFTTIPIQLVQAFSRSIYVALQYAASFQEIPQISDSEGHIYRLASSAFVPIPDSLLFTSIFFTDLLPTDPTTNLTITININTLENGFAEVIEITGANNPSFDPNTDPPLFNSNSGNDLRPFVVVPPFGEPPQNGNFGLMSVAAQVTEPSNQIVFRPLSSFSIIPPIMLGENETIAGGVFGNIFHTTPIVMRTVIDNVSLPVTWVATAIPIQFPSRIPPPQPPPYCDIPVNASLDIMLSKKL